MLQLVLHDVIADSTQSLMGMFCQSCVFISRSGEMSSSFSDCKTYTCFHSSANYTTWYYTISLISLIFLATARESLTKKTFSMLKCHSSLTFHAEFMMIRNKKKVVRLNKQLIEKYPDHTYIVYGKTPPISWFSSMAHLVYRFQATCIHVQWLLCRTV